MECAGGMTHGKRLGFEHVGHESRDGCFAVADDHAAAGARVAQVRAQLRLEFSHFHNSFGGLLHGHKLVINGHDGQTAQSAHGVRGAWPMVQRVGLADSV